MRLLKFTAVVFSHIADISYFSNSNIAASAVYYKILYAAI